MTEVMIRPDAERFVDPVGPGPHPVHIDQLVFQVSIRFNVPEERAIKAVQAWIEAIEIHEGHTVDQSNLTAWDVLYVFDGLADFEWTYY